jgi:hypothetical protein
VCGDGTCQAGSEDCASCESDCGLCPPECGDGNCQDPENACTCPSDCATDGGFCDCSTLPEGCVFSSWGDPVSGYPNWHERTVELFTNAVRVDPIAYRDNYSADHSPSTATILNAYPAQDPYTWSNPLNISARGHAIDMATNNYFSHTSQNGDSPVDRMTAAGYNEGGGWGENIAAGNSTPRRTVNQWLCDRVSDGNGGSICCADGDSCDGHRRSIMSGGFTEMGVGYAYDASATYRYYWVQNFGGGTQDTASPLITGSHSLTVQSGQVSFLAAVNDSGAALPALSVVIDGVETAMTLDLGNTHRGLYRADSATTSGCRSYYFVMTDGNAVVWRYPGTGAFRTYSESGCAEEFQAAP